LGKRVDLVQGDGDNGIVAKLMGRDGRRIWNNFVRFLFNLKI